MMRVLAAVMLTLLASEAFARTPRRPAAPAPIVTAPAPKTVVTPRVITVGTALTMVGRHFNFDAPLQKERSFPRLGMALDLEVQPLRYWDLGGLGIAFGWQRETGQAVLPRDEGEERLEIVEQRWTLGVGWDFEIGDRLVLTPDIGLARVEFQARNALEALPSQCPAWSTDICLPRVDLLGARTGARVKAALTDDVGLVGAVHGLAGLDLDGTPGALAAEANTTTFGYDAEVALLWRLADWVAARAAFTFTSLRHSFSSSQDIGYTRADERYYAGAVGLVVAAGP